MSKTAKFNDALVLLEIINPEEIMKMTFIRILTKKLSHLDSSIRSRIIYKMLNLFDPISLKKAQSELYYKYYTHKEIRDMITFYKSATGKKILKVGPKLVLDLANVIDEWSVLELKKNDSKIMDIVKETMEEHRINQPSKTLTRQEFALNYAINKGWGEDLTKLTTEQMAEIMACDEWDKLI